MGRLLVLGISLAALSAVAWRAWGTAPRRPATATAATARATATPEPEPEPEIDRADPPAASAPIAARPSWAQVQAAPIGPVAPSGLSGMVVTPSGAAPDVSVLLESLDQGRAGVLQQTDRGQFRFDAPPGRYRLRPYGAITGETLEIELGAGERLDGLELRVNPPAASAQNDSDDAILDVVDRCPDVPDDQDDIDGCPDIDRDATVETDAQGRTIIRFAEIID